MTKLKKAISLGMAVAMMTASLPNLAAADDDDRGRRHHAREYRDDDDRGHRRRDWHHKKERHYKHYKKERHYKHHRKERRHKRVEKHHHKKVVVHKYHEKRVVVHKHKYKKKKRSHDLLPLLAVVGITAAVLHANAAQAKPKSRDIEWNPAPAPRQVATAQPEPRGPAATCLMTREYQTQIVVNGKLVDGYGHACLQPDGTWYRGPAVVSTY